MAEGVGGVEEKDEFRTPPRRLHHRRLRDAQIELRWAAVPAEDRRVRCYAQLSAQVALCVQPRRSYNVRDDRRAAEHAR